MTSKELDVHMGRVFRDLHPGFDDTHSVGRVTAVGEAHYESLHGDATINEFIPLLVYRFAKEELARSERHELVDAA